MAPVTRLHPNGRLNSTSAGQARPLARPSSFHSSHHRPLDEAGRHGDPLTTASCFTTLVSPPASNPPLFPRHARTAVRLLGTFSPVHPSNRLYNNIKSEIGDESERDDEKGTGGVKFN